MKNIINKIVLISFTLLIFLSCKSNSEKKSKQTEGKVKIETISIASKVAGRVQKVMIQEGQFVQKGDTLLIIEVPEIESKMLQVVGAVEAAQGQLELAHNGATEDQLSQIQSQLDVAQAQLDFAQKSMQRMQNMFDESLIPAQQYDEVKSKYRAAQAQVVAIKAKQKEVKSGTRYETIKSAHGQLQRAIGARDEVLQADKERFIIAPADMTIESITLQVGELASPGYTIVNGFTQSDLYFRFTIGERSINAYHIGQQVKIMIPNTERVIEAKIVAVKQMPRYADNTSTVPNREIGESFFELKVVPENLESTKNLYNNSSVLLQL